jgi:hypothetical protein
MPSDEPVEIETGTDAGPRPPARVRYLAVATHIGFWFAFIPLYQAEFAYHLDDVPGWVQAALILISRVTPVVTAFAAARRSEWRSFLRTHAIAACTAHAALAAAVLTVSFLDSSGWELPEALEHLLWSASSIVLLAWVILPFGAAYRAKDGDLPWYPVITRLMSRRTAGAG